MILSCLKILLLEGLYQQQLCLWTFACNIFFSATVGLFLALRDGRGCAIASGFNIRLLFVFNTKEDIECAKRDLSFTLPSAPGSTQQSALDTYTKSFSVFHGAGD